jgi:hypothetical protein
MKNTTSLTAFIIKFIFSLFFSLFFTFTDAQIITTVAGNGVAGLSGDGGAATAAELNLPSGVAFDHAGNMYLAVRNNDRIRKVSTSGIITTVAGVSTGYSGDGGQATAAELSTPYDVALDGAGNIYIADASNARIRKVTVSTGIISTIAGNGHAGYSGDGSAATAAEINNPLGVGVDSYGNIYIAEQGNNRIRIVNTSGVISTFAGNGTASYSGDGGQATAAEINHPYSVVVDDSNNIFIADKMNYRIRKVNTSGIITTIAGNGVSGNNGNGGQATAAELDMPTGVARVASGNLYIVDGGADRVRMVNTSGIISSAAGNSVGGYSGDGGQATAAEFSSPMKIAFDCNGNFYITDQSNDRIREVYYPPNVTVSITNVSCNGGSNGIATATATVGSPPYTYLWAPGSQTTACITGLSAATYTITVTDKFGMTNSTMATITQPTTLSVSASVTTEVSCGGGNNGSASSTPSGGTSPYTYSWSGGGTNCSKTGLTAGTYTISLTDNNGCTATASVTITQPIALRDSIVLSSIINVSTTGGHNGSATVGAKYGTPPYTYLWSPGGETSANATNLIAGIFTVTVTDNNGCTATAAVTITQPLSILIPLSSDTCIYSDTMSTVSRWFVVTPASSSMSITITNLTPAAGHIHDINVFDGVYPYRICPIAKTSLRNDTTNAPLTITLNDLFVGIPIYIDISRGRNAMRCGGCSTSYKADFNLCTQDLTPPTRTVDGNGVVYYNSVPQYMENQIVIKFQDSSLILSAINDTALHEGPMSDFFRTAYMDTITFYMTSYGFSSGAISSITLKKVFPKFTLKDSVTTSLQGRSVHNNDLWATFVMTFPLGINWTSYNEVQKSRLLSLANGVEYAQPNGVSQRFSNPNDSYFSSQYNLVAGGIYTNCDINMLPAWTFSTGSPGVSIGILDDGIDNTCDDFWGGISPNIIIGGYDYYNGWATLGTPLDGHGTFVAGTAAAKRNNSEGIAGIAGGDYSSSSQGCPLYDLRIAAGAALGSDNVIYNGIEDGFTTYGVNIMSMSYGNLSSSTTYLQRDAVSYVDQNGVVFVAARGNYPDVTPITQAVYPACLGENVDYLTIAVGGSGTDGNWWTTSNGVSGDGGDQSLYTNVDIIAPATFALDWGPESGSPTVCEQGSGTSFAAPQVAGVVGLMDSYLSTALCIEDATNLIEMFATPTTGSNQNTFPNDYSGWGRLNAGWVLSNLQSPNTLNHFQSNDASTTTTLTATSYATGVTITTDENYQGLNAGTYTADVYELDYVMTFSTPLSDPILAYWPRFSSTYGMNSDYAATDLDLDNWSQVLSCTSTGAEIVTYAYDVQTGSGDVWLPQSTTSADYVALTVFTGYEQSDPPNSIQQVSNPKLNTDIFPNPASDYTNIDYSLSCKSDVKITIYNSIGDIVESLVNNSEISGFHQNNISLSKFSPGLYLVEIIAGNSVAQKKLVVLK